MQQLAELKLKLTGWSQTRRVVVMRLSSCHLISRQFLDRVAF
jgi:hypothetical protein